MRAHTFPNGVTVKFKDCIHHTTTTKFPLLQRIKHLLGAPVVIKSELHCENEPGYILSEAKGVNTRVFKRRRKGGVEMMCHEEE